MHNNARSSQYLFAPLHSPKNFGGLYAWEESYGKNSLAQQTVHGLHKNSFMRKLVVEATGWSTASLSHTRYHQFYHQLWLTPLAIGKSRCTGAKIDRHFTITMHALSTTKTTHNYTGSVCHQNDKSNFHDYKTYFLFSKTTYYIITASKRADVVQFLLWLSE